jgi:hypothetical protein
MLVVEFVGFVRSPNAAPIKRLAFTTSNKTLSNRPWRPICHPIAANLSFKLSRSPSTTIRTMHLFSLSLSSKKKWMTKEKKAKLLKKFIETTRLFRRHRPRVIQLGFERSETVWTKCNISEKQMDPCLHGEKLTLLYLLHDNFF